MEQNSNTVLEGRGQTLAVPAAANEPHDRGIAFHSSCSFRVWLHVPVLFSTRQ